MKVLYAAGNYRSAKLPLMRFLDEVKDKPYKIKIAAYKQSSPKNTNIDWTLDCLRSNRGHSLLSNDNLEIYRDNVRHFTPDVIISDMEPYSSVLGAQLNIPVWQCSSSLINYGLSKESAAYSQTYKKYSAIYARKPEPLKFSLHNADARLVYSHFGDLENPPELLPGYEWVRPYFKLGESYPTCRHNVISANFNMNRKIISILEKMVDSVLFSYLYDENHNLFMKDLNNQEEYFCNLYNSELFLIEGQTSFLADAYYNKKYTIVLPNFEDYECVLNAMHSERYGLSTTIYSDKNDLSSFFGREIKATINSRIKFLHEKLEEL